MVADTLSRLPINVNQKTTNESTYTMETILELYDINELPDVTSPISSNIIYRYQKEYSFLTENLILQNIKRVIFVEARIL